MKMKNSPLERDLSQCSDLGSLARPSGVAVLHHCLESVRGTMSQEHLKSSSTVRLLIYICSSDSVIIVYLTEYTVNGLLVHLASDSIFAQARSNSAEVVQRCHPECHFCLLVTELVHLGHKKWRRNVTTKTNINNTGQVSRDDRFEENDATHQQPPK